MKNVLITGGAGFIGQRLARSLLNDGFFIRIIDNFSPQIHSTESLPDDLAGHVDLINADIRNADALKLALNNIDVVVHLAAETGTGQSMYEINKYFDVNVQGTANLLQILQEIDSVRSIVVASSRAVYGEGAYFCVDHNKVFPHQRLKEDMQKGRFEPVCPYCNVDVKAIPTNEYSPFSPMSMYGLTKQTQEQAVLLYARTKGLNAFGLRFQNVYGPGQSLKNPYTGILAVFSNLARQHKDIEVYEDGLESRDFVYIDDVVESIVHSIKYTDAYQGAINVGSGVKTSVHEVAEMVNSFFSGKGEIKVNGSFRLGDIRHNIADLTLANNILNFRPKVEFRTGLINFLEWASSSPVVCSDSYKNSVTELTEKGLMGGRKL